MAYASGNIPNTPAAAQPGIVLPAFARSGPADRPPRASISRHVIARRNDEATARVHSVLLAVATLRSQ